MKIAAIKTTPLALAFKEPCHWAGRVDYAAAVVLVEVETDDGLLGVGESVAAFPAEGTVAVLRKLGLLERPGLGVELDRDAVRRAAELYERDERYHDS